VVRLRGIGLVAELTLFDVGHETIPEMERPSSAAAQAAVVRETRARAPD